MDPASDFAGAQVGEFIAWECDAYIPDISRILAPDGVVAKRLTFFADMLNAALSGKALRIGDIDPATADAQQLTDMKAQVNAVNQLLKGVNARRSVIGEDSDTDWKVFGAIDAEHLRVDDIDDERLVIVGKIKRRLEKGRWRRLAELLNAEMPNRAERRRMEKEHPPQGKEAEYVAGPALELDVLAINR